MRKILSWPSTLVAVLFVAMFVAPASPAVAAPAGTSVTAERDRQLRERIVALLPADHRARLAALQEDLDLADGDLQGIAESVIDPADYVCTTTPLQEWLTASIAGWTASDFADALVLMLLNPVMNDALLFPEPAAGRFFGLDGEYTNTLQRSFRGLKQFWDINASDIELVPAHGSMMLDRARVARTMRAVFGLSEADAAEIAEDIATIADQPQFDYGNHPLFTFNAFAFSAHGQEIPGLGIPSDAIVVGDGILEGLRGIGLGDVAPSAVLDHEFGHHIQYQRNLFESPLTGAEASRRTELMADSFGSYFASHPLGGNLRWERTRKFLQTYYDLGDCQFDDPAHHGTPAQRLRAADWGHDMAVHAWPPARILPSATFARLFEKQLPSFVAPDAP